MSKAMQVFDEKQIDIPKNNDFKVYAIKQRHAVNRRQGI